MKRFKEKQKLHIPKIIFLFYVTTNSEMVPELVHPKLKKIGVFKSIKRIMFSHVLLRLKIYKGA